MFQFRIKTLTMLFKKFVSTPCNRELKNETNQDNCRGHNDQMKNLPQIAEISQIFYGWHSRNHDNPCNLWRKVKYDAH